MDIETLTNHISKLGKTYFEKACNIVLRDVFLLNAINVDGKSDGGTDFIDFDNDGKRTKVGYQITTQKSDIQNKAYNDAKKAIEKLQIKKFFFLTTFNLSEIELRLLESRISNELKIDCSCYSPKLIAGILIESGKLNKFLEDVDYPLPRQHGNIVDYKEKALHGYSVFSDESHKFRYSVYDDTLLFLLQESSITESELIRNVLKFLNLNDEKYEFVKNRINALFAKELIFKDDDNLISLTTKSREDINNRQKIYEIELASLTSAQTDLLTGQYGISWTADDSKKISIWIANSYILNQLENLKEVNATIVNKDFYNISENSLNKLKDFFKNNKKVENEKIDKIIDELLEIASTHPLITKITRASVYVALEGSNPIASAKAIGASRWSDVNIIVEPTVAIPFICSTLFKGNSNISFKYPIKSIEQAKSLDSLLFIPYYYIRECAGHLLNARKYIGFEDQANELEFSNNAFIANYFQIKNKGKRVPDTIEEYLEIFSPAIRTPRDDSKMWVRSIMVDIQSILNTNGIQFLDIPHYDYKDIEDIDELYKETLRDLEIEKKRHLIKNDVYTLKSANDRIINNNEVWTILTFDKSLISFSRNNYFKGWITNPIKFLEITELSKPINETKLISLVHSVATYSEKTLAIGARIMDRIINLSSKDIQNWELKAEIDKFKIETISNIDINDPKIYEVIDGKTEEFINKHGLNQKEETENFDNDDDSIEINPIIE